MGQKHFSKSGSPFEAYRKELLLARDPFGIKPLYNSDDGATLYTVKALLTGGPIEPMPEPVEHVGFYLCA